MARSTFSWDAKFTLDPAAGETHRTVITLDGYRYEVNIAPADNLEKLRKLHERLDKSAGEQSISLGPRGGGRCDCCGR